MKSNSSTEGIGFVQRSERSKAALVMLFPCAMTGCSRAPTFNILGSFFPAWLICMCLGIVLAAVVNRIFVHFNFDREIAWTIIVYPCLALFFACTVWLIFFS